MSDYRNFDDQPRRGLSEDRNARVGHPTMNAAWGWIAAAVFLVVVLAMAFGIVHRPGQTGTNTASNDATPPAMTRMAPPTANPGPNAATAPASLGTPAIPITPTPNSPAQRSQP